jgi:hypothetical protein
MKNLMFLAAIAVVLTVFNGCQKDMLSIDKKVNEELNAKKPDVYLENDYLAFKNMTAVDSVINVLNKMSRQEKDAWEQKIGLKSARYDFEKLFDEYEKIASNDEFVSFKTKYTGKLKFNEINATDCSINYPFANTYFTSVMNNKGVFKVGLSLFKFTKEDQIIILDGDTKKLENLSANLNDKNVIVNSRLKSAQEESYTLIDDFADDNPFGVIDSWWTKGDRMLLNELLWYKYMYWYTTDSFGHPVYKYGYILYLRQTAMKHTWLGWNTYYTTYEFKDIRCKTGSGPTVLVSFPNGGESPEVKPDFNWHILKWESLSTNFNLYELMVQPSFSMQGLVWSRGLDDILNPLIHKDPQHPIFP